MPCPQLSSNLYSIWIKSLPSNYFQWLFSPMPFIVFLIKETHTQVCKAGVLYTDSFQASPLYASFILLQKWNHSIQFQFLCSVSQSLSLCVCMVDIHIPNLYSFTYEFLCLCVSSSLPTSSSPTSGFYFCKY